MRSLWTFLLFLCHLQQVALNVLAVLVCCHIYKSDVLSLGRQRIVGKDGYLCFSHRDKYLCEEDGVELEIAESLSAKRIEVVYRRSGLDQLPDSPDFPAGGYPHVTATIFVIRVLDVLI